MCGASTYTTAGYHLTCRKHWSEYTGTVGVLHPVPASTVPEQHAPEASAKAVPAEPPQDTCPSSSTCTMLQSAPVHPALHTHCPSDTRHACFSLEPVCVSGEQGSEHRLFQVTRWHAVTSRQGVVARRPSCTHMRSYSEPTDDVPPYIPETPCTHLIGPRAVCVLMACAWCIAACYAALRGDRQGHVAAVGQTSHHPCATAAR